MTSRVISLEEWAVATCGSMEDVATGALGLADFKISTVHQLSTDADCGGYIPLLTDLESVQIGLATDLESCRKLSRLLLVLDDDEPDPPLAEVRDAIGEIANVMAGAIKTRICNAREGVDIQLGLPFFVHGRIAPVAGLADAVLRFEAEGITCDIHVMHRPHRDKRRAA